MYMHLITRKRPLKHEYKSFQNQVIEKYLKIVKMRAELNAQLLKIGFNND